MDMTVGTVQGLLAAVFLMAGLVKVVQPKKKLTKRMSWVELRAEHDTFNRDCGAPGGYRNCVIGLNRNPSLADTPGGGGTDRRSGWGRIGSRAAWRVPDDRH